MALLENYNNLCPFYDIGLIKSQDSVDSHIVFRDADEVIKGSINNGIIINSEFNGNLTNNLSNSVLNLQAFNTTDKGVFCFAPLNQGSVLLNNNTYAIIFDMKGNCSNNSDLIGFTDSLANINTTIYPANSIYKNINLSDNLNCYFIFTCNNDIINIYKYFMVGWSDLTDKQINLQLTTLQVYNITQYLEDNSLDDFELWMIKHLKTHSFLEKSVNEINNSTTEYNNNGVIKIPYNFNEG